MLKNFPLALEELKKEESIETFLYLLWKTIFKIYRMKPIMIWPKSITMSIV